MKKRILSLVLCAAMLLSMCLFLGAGVAEDTSDTPAESTAAAESYAPAVNFTNVAPFVEMNAQVQHGPARAPMFSAASANAANTQLVTNDGVVTTKTATANDDSTYTITLTSYTTGDVKQQQTTKPTDFVLVLDQSGSMNDHMGTVKYEKYKDKNSTNADNYGRRHNGGSANLWHKLGDGSYVSVSVSRQEKWTYTQLGDLKNGQPVFGGDKGYSQYADDGNLYEKVDTEYKKVTVTREWNGRGYTYTYTFEDGSTVVSSGYNNAPNLGVHYPLYAGSMDYEYTYTCTDSTGAVQTIGTSTGASVRFEPAFYQRSVDTSSGDYRLYALKKAATNFADKIAESAKGADGLPETADDVAHRIAVVGFSSDGYNNNEILTGCKVSENNGVQYVEKPASGTSESYTNYLTSCGKALVEPSAAKTAIDYLTANGGTETDKGMRMAKDILDNDSMKNSDRNRVVVLFTDGLPQIYNTDEDVSITARADRAISIANSICDVATVYSIGVFAGADGNLSNGLPTNTGDWDDAAMANRFMHLVSSNYPDATAMDSAGSINSGLKNNDSYYLSAGDADSLKDIFEKISDNISNPNILLGSSAYVQDTVSPYFTAPVNGTVTVSTQLAKYDASGNLTWADEAAPTGLTPEVNGKTVKVTGFDYDKNFVSVTGRDENDSKKDGTFHGRRLVVTFTVEAEAAFLGGNNVPTNVAESSGVYQSDGTVVENFDQPEVNVPIKAPKLTNKDANVYYGGDVPSAEQLCSTAAYDNAMADFVTIRYETNDTVSNTHDSTYTVTMTVSPKDEAKKTSSGEAAEAQSATVTSKVNVYKPEITYKDSVINLGDIANYENNFVSTEWKHGEQTSTDADVTMVGIAPELTYTYNPEAGKFTQDTYVNVTVKIGERDIPADVVTFRHDPCTFPGCKYTDDCGYQFYVHIKVFDLTIKKTAKAGTTIDPNQTFVFRVHGNNNDVDMQVVITGPGEQTIKNLPMGSYTVTEDTSWSWKYTPTSKDQPVTTSNIKNGAATVTFENENNGTNWLTSLAKALNKWTKDGTTVTRDPKN